MIVPNVHTESRTRLHLGRKERVARAVARAAYGVTRLMPIIFEHAIIGWCGWSWREGGAIVLHHKPWMRTWIDRNGLLLGFVNVDDLINSITNNGHLRQLMWFKCSPGGSGTTTWVHTYATQGWPCAGLWNGTAFTARQHDDTEQGAIMHGGNVSPSTKHLLGGTIRIHQAAATDIKIFVLYDMVLSYDSCLVTNAPTSFINTLPALRYVGVGDPGLSIMSCVNSATTGNIAFTALNYTSIGGTAGQTVTAALLEAGSGTPSATTVYSTAFQFTNGNIRTILNAPLVNTDGGCKQLDSITMGSLPVTGENLNYILGFQLAWMPTYVDVNEDVFAFDFVKQIPSVPRIRDGACLTYAFMAAQGSSTSWESHLKVAWSG